MRLVFECRDQARRTLRPDGLITPYPVFLAQHHHPSTRVAAHRTWLREGIGEGELANIRMHLEQEQALGDPTFHAMVEKALGRPAKVRHRGRPKQSEIEPENI